MLPLRIVVCVNLRGAEQSLEQTARHKYGRRQKRAGADIANAMVGGDERGRSFLLPSSSVRSERRNARDTIA